MAAPPADLWKKAKRLDFTIQQERWGQYEVDNDVVVRARMVLLSLFKVHGEKDQPASLAPTSAVLMAVDSPFKSRGTPSDPAALPQKIQESEKVEVPFRTLDEPWNEYLFDDSGPKLLRMKLVVSGVSRVADLYDATGAPIYQISHATVVAPPLPRKAIPGK